MRLWLKIAMVLAMTLAILVPLLLIRGVIADRQHYRMQAFGEVAQRMGGAQRVAGPVLVVPYSEWLEETFTDRDSGQLRTVRKRVERELTVFPEALAVQGELKPETRRRGLHAIRAYVWSATLDGRFELALPAADASERRYGQPRLVWLLGDVRGLRGTPRLTVDGQVLRLQQGSGMGARPGLHVLLDAPSPGTRLALRPVLQLQLGGTETLAVLPVGRSNDIALSSPWPHPRFDGLPAQHRIGAEGFTARWQVDALATDAQQRWLEIGGVKPAGGPARVEVAEAAAGDIARDLAQVSLIDPVDAYTQADRATKYGILFVLLTFLGFFLFELLRRVPVHPIQYALVGLAIAIFFLLLVSLSEHMLFGRAYLLAAAACIALIVFYLSAVLRGWKAALGFGGLLVTLYGVLYGLLLSEDNALALGSGLLFAILAAVMVGTRKVDWYALAPVGKPLPASAPDAADRP